MTWVRAVTSNSRASASAMMLARVLSSTSSTNFMALLDARPDTVTSSISGASAIQTRRVHNGEVRQVCSAGMLLRHA